MAGSSGVLQVCGAAQQVHRIRLLAMQRQPAGADALEVEDVVDQADEAIAIADGDVEHLGELLRPLLEHTAGDEAERGAQGSERRAQLVAHGGDELVLHAIEAAALRDIREGDDRTAYDSVVHELAGDVFHGEGGAVLAPEDLVVHAHRLLGVERPLDGAILVSIGRAVRLGVVDQLVRVLADDLVHLVAEHAGAGLVAEGEIAVDVETPDAVAYGGEDRFALPHERVQLILGIGLLGDVDAMAQHDGLGAGQLQQLVAIGNHGRLAIWPLEIEQPLMLVLFVQRTHVLLVVALVVVRDVVEERRADDLLRGVAEDSGGVRVDRLNVAVEVVGADDAERAFDEVAIARLTGAQAIELLPLLGDIDAGGDDEIDVALRIVERAGGPGDAAHSAVARAPVHLVTAIELAGACLLEHAHGVIAFFGREELFRKRAADQFGKAEAAYGFACAIEAHDASGGVEHQHQRVNRIENGGDEVALHGESALDALTRAHNAVLLIGLGVELKPRDDLPRQHFERAAMLAGKHVRLRRADGQRAEHSAVGREDGRRRIRAAVRGGGERHAGWRKAIVLRGIVDDHRVRLKNGVLAGRCSARLLAAQEADA